MADTQRKLGAWLSPPGCSRHMARGDLQTALGSSAQPGKQCLGEMGRIFRLSLGQNGVYHI